LALACGVSLILGPGVKQRAYAQVPPAKNARAEDGLVPFDREPVELLPK
jgi:hypothetical protein